MVHALEIIHEMLKAEGILINIQPSGKDRPLQIHSIDEVKQAGLIGHRIDYALHKKALAALNQVVDDGLFVFERIDSFPFLYHAETVDIMQEWIFENWENSILDEGTIRRAVELEKTTEKPSEVVVRQDMHISRLRSS
jgi:hypothetical protein